MTTEYGTSEHDIVTRRVDRPAEAVAIAVSAGLTAERLRLCPRHDRLVPAWSTTRRLGLTAVDIEVAAWSRTSAELSIRPRSRRVHRWTTRRARRYFDRAHALADVFAARAE